MTFLNPEDVQRYFERVKKWQIYAKKRVMPDASPSFQYAVYLFFPVYFISDVIRIYAYAGLSTVSGFILFRERGDCSQYRSEGTGGNQDLNR